MVGRAWAWDRVTMRPRCDHLQHALTAVGRSRASHRLQGDVQLLGEARGRGHIEGHRAGAGAGEAWGNFHQFIEGDKHMCIGTLDSW